MFELACASIPACSDDKKVLANLFVWYQLCLFNIASFIGFSMMNDPIAQWSPFLFVNISFDSAPFPGFHILSVPEGLVFC